MNLTFTKSLMRIVVLLALQLAPGMARAQQQNSAKPKIRTITAFIRLDQQIRIQKIF